MPATCNGRDLAFLEAVNSRLDQLVKRRTLDLVSANQRLLREIATRRKAELELERSRDELRSLAEHLHLAQEAERTRMAIAGRGRAVLAAREASRDGYQDPECAIPRQRHRTMAVQV